MDNASLSQVDMDGSSMRKVGGSMVQLRDPNMVKLGGNSYEVNKFMSDLANAPAINHSQMHVGGKSANSSHMMINVSDLDDGLDQRPR